MRACHSTYFGKNNGRSEKISPYGVRLHGSNSPGYPRDRRLFSRTFLPLLYVLGRKSGGRGGRTFVTTAASTSACNTPGFYQAAGDGNRDVVLERFSGEEYEDTLSEGMNAAPDPLPSGGDLTMQGGVNMIH